MRRRPPRSRRTRLSAALVSLTFASGCVGQIGAPEGILSPPAAPTPGRDAGTQVTPPPPEDAATPEDAGPTVIAPSDVLSAPDDRPTEPAGPDPGRVTIHRLNRAEYNNTVRDLLGTTRRPADEFPADDRGYGYDNIADVLSLSPVQVELYLRATTQLLDEALANPTAPSTRTQYEAESLRGSVGQATANAWNLWSNGAVTAAYTAPVAGQYRVTVRAWQTRAGTDNARMAVDVAGARAQEFMVPNESASPGEFTVTTTIRTAGRVDVSAAFLNDFLIETPRQDRNLYVDWIRVEGPLDAATRTNPARQRIMTCAPTMGVTADSCARQIFARFGRRAWRRPLTSDELTGLAGFLDVARAQDEGFEAGVKLGLQAILMSPHFVFRVEVDPDPTSRVPHRLTDHELATRLSYFLWSSMPDEALDALADAGRLHEPATLLAQVDRMLADPKARALTENFAGQWLFTRAVDEHDVDPMHFPQLTAALRGSYRAETEAYFEEFLRNDVGMNTFLTADFTYVDDRLASWYGLNAPSGTGVRRVSLRGSNRTGILMQGGLLTVTSHPDRTSPVRRGQWVLSQLLCEPPRPPPPSVEGLPAETNPTGTLRQRMERHRSNPSCAACHQLMDPIGFGLENFDAIGRWRTMDSGFPIDPAGALPGGVDFRDAAGMASQIAQDPRYPRCVTQQLFTYALGRGPEDHDNPTIDGITAAWSSNGMRLRDLIKRIALSDSFTTRRGEPMTGGAR